MDQVNQVKFSTAVMTLTGLIFLAGGYMITVTPEISEPFTRNLLDRLLPLMIWITGLATQTLIFLFMVRYRDLKNRSRSRPTVFLFTLAFLGSTFLVWAWIAKVSLPLESQVRGWNSQGVPILEMQIFLAWLLSIILLAALIRLENQAKTKSWLQRFKPGHLDILISLLLWGAAVLLWQSIPVPPSWFVTEQRPPNFEQYPNSDAFYYDTSAQTALVGEGFVFFDTPFIRRPLHATFLTLLHLIGGQDFQRVILLQVLVLACYPVLVYLVTRTIDNRLSGLIVAILALLRETSSIAISGNITASHVKLLMVDMPITLVVAGFMLAAIHWLNQIHLNKFKSLVAGGVLGASILIRAETLIFLIPLSLIAFFVLAKEKSRARWPQQMMLFLWGILLVITPWVWRNWDMTGFIFLDSPISRFDLVAQRYQPVFDGVQTTTTLPTQTVAPTAAILESTPTVPGTVAPANVEIPSTQASATSEPAATQETEAGQFVKSVKQNTINFILENPGEVALFIVSHYTNSQIQMLYLLPTTFRPLDSLVGFVGHRSLDTFWDECCTTQNYVRRMPYWHKWNGALPLQSALPLVVNIVFVSWGVQTAWRKNRLIGITPLMLSLTYLMLNALFRNSGGRYILPVDWITLVYFSIGLSDLSVRLLQIFFKFDFPKILVYTAANARLSTGRNSIFRQPQFYGLTLGLLLLGSLAPLTEKAFAQRYTVERQNEMVAGFMHSMGIDPGKHVTLDQQTALEQLLANGGTILSGRALYPRFFREFLGEPGSANPFGPKPYPRLSFQLAGPSITTIILPLENKPSYLPNASDVLVFGCSEEETLAIAVMDETSAIQAFYMRSPLPLSLSCPFPPQDIAVQPK